MFSTIIIVYFLNQLWVYNYFNVSGLVNGLWTVIGRHDALIIAGKVVFPVQLLYLLTPSITLPLPLKSTLFERYSFRSLIIPQLSQLPLLLQNNLNHSLHLYILLHTHVSTHVFLSSFNSHMYYTPLLGSLLNTHKNKPIYV